MRAEQFIDTNVFIYQLDPTDAVRHHVADGIVRSALARGNACISSQVAQECLNLALRKAEQPLTAEEARRYFDVVLSPLIRIWPSDALYHRALDVRSRWGFGFHDALIIAGALQAGCRQLLTEDLQHGQQLDGLTVINPFR